MTRNCRKSPKLLRSSICLNTPLKNCYPQPFHCLPGEDGREAPAVLFSG